MYFDAPKLDADSGLEFSYEQQPKDGKGDKLKSFNGRLSNAQVVKKVTVRGWDPEKKQEVVGEEQAKPSKLGSSNAASSRRFPARSRPTPSIGRSRRSRRRRRSPSRCWTRRR